VGAQGNARASASLERRIKVGVAEIPPFTFVLCRTLVAALVLFSVLKLRGNELPRTRQMWVVLVTMGLLNGVIPYTLITWGETHITSGLASILNAAMPLFTVLLAHYWTHDERVADFWCDVGRACIA